MSPSAMALLAALAAGAPALEGASQALEIYVVDVGHGDAAFAVSPSGEVLMLDAGPPQATNRILNFMRQNGIERVDYLVVSHFEADHMGAAPLMAEKVPIRNWVDHGQSVVYGKDDEWWKQRRGPWARPGMGKQYDQSFDVFTGARAKSNHIVVKPGDAVPVKGLDVRVVSAAGKVLSKPLEGVKGAGAPVAACSAVDRRAEDDAEDGQSVGVVLTLGKFRMAYLGDLTWNNENSLFCPVNRVGAVDAYIITHHAQAMPRRLGDYYFGLSCCPPPELEGLNPRVAILSMGSQGHREGTPDAMKTVKASRGLEDLWQTEKVTGGGEKDENAADQFIANIGPPGERVPYIRITAQPDGSFRVTNGRNQFSKEYAARR